MNEQGAKKAGIVYILSNAGLEGLVKVGMVESLNPRAIKTRIGHLRAGSPYVYHVEGAARAKDAKASESQLHDLMLNNRMGKPGGGTEWFAMTPEQAKKFLVALPHLALIPRTELDAAFGLTAQPKPKALPPHKKFTFGLVQHPRRGGAEIPDATVCHVSRGSARPTEGRILRQHDVAYRSDFGAEGLPREWPAALELPRQEAG